MTKLALFNQATAVVVLVYGAQLLSADDLSQVDIYKP
jgi:hypothetical protein